MPQNPPAGMPQCCPCLFYDDVDAAMEFLTRAFGFEVRFAHRMPDGKTVHAQLGLGKGLVMMGPTNAPGALRPCKSAKSAGGLHASVYYFVDDVDAHCARARQAGAEILADPSDAFWGDRIYCAVDPEGQFWAFATHVRDFAPPGKPA